MTASFSPNGIVPKPSKPLTKSPHASAVVPAKTAMTSQITTSAMITVCSFPTVR